MPLKAFIAVPTDLREWSRYLEGVAIQPDAGSVGTSALEDHGVTLVKLADIAGLSILGNPVTGLNAVSQIGASSDGDVLRRSGSTLGFGTIPETSVLNLTTDLAGKVSVTTHVNAGSGLTGGGALTSDVVLALDPIPALALLGRLDAFKTADTTITSSTSLTADPHLSVTVAAATYDFEAFLCFYEATLGTGGFQFDLASGSATISNILWAADGYGTAVLANPAATAANTAQTYATIATSSSAPSWVRVSGQVTFSATGTFALRWAQASSSANGTTLKAKSYLTLQKVA